jgi:autotransporter-associated beta strand protein
MLLIDGALAVFNGLLVATGKFWCECVRGGTCCGGECRCDEGECCGGVWHPGGEPEGFCCADQWFVVGQECQEGFVYFEIIRDQFRCCTCISQEVVDAGLGPDSVYWCCDEEGPYKSNDSGQCKRRCCDGLNCVMQFPDECQNTSLDGSCLALGCPASCCIESDDGFVSCETQGSNICENVTKGIVDEEPCESACKGACCVDGELTEGSPTTQAECDALGGCWYGIGSTECGEGLCRAPFDEDCCEHAVSSAASLTFTGPRKRRCPELDGCGFEVTVSVTTGQPVYVHGNQFGNPYEACTEVATFVTCNDTFRVTPAPCTGNLDKLDIEVCWDDGSGPELLRFHCCDGTYLLGNCECDCVTTLLYEGPGCTSAAALQMNGEAIIEANGTGPLVLTANITQTGSCTRKLTLSGTSTQANEISGVIQDSSSGLSVVKTGTCLWRLSGANAFTGQLKVETGTLVVADDVGASGASPIGDVSGASSMPLIGTSTSGANFFLDNVTMSRGAWTVAAGSGTVAIGGIGTGTAIFSTSYTTRLGRDVTLQAGSGGTARFGNVWQDGSGGSNPAVAFTIGSTGNDGTVVLESDLPNSITSLTLVTGTLKTDFDDRIAPATPVTIQSATYDRDGFNQSIDSLTVTGTATFAGSGTTTVNNSLSGSGSIVNSAGTLQIDGTNTMTGSVSITGGSVVVTTVVSGPSGLNTATFTNTTLTVDFSSAPSSGQQFKLLYGSTVQSYAPTLTGAGGATATYNSSNSTLTID